MRKVAVAVTGASGSVYAKVLFDKLLDLQVSDCRTGYSDV